MNVRENDHGNVQQNDFDPRNVLLNVLRNDYGNVFMNVLRSANLAAYSAHAWK